MHAFLCSLRKQEEQSIPVKVALMTLHLLVSSCRPMSHDSLPLHVSIAIDQLAWQSLHDITTMMTSPLWVNATVSVFLFSPWQGTRQSN